MRTSVESAHTSILLRRVSTRLCKLSPLSQEAGSRPGALLADPGGHVLAVTHACWASLVCRAKLGEVKADAQVASSMRLTLQVGIYIRSWTLTPISLRPQLNSMQSTPRRSWRWSRPSSWSWRSGRSFSRKPSRRTWSSTSPRATCRSWRGEASRGAPRGVHTGCCPGVGLRWGRRGFCYTRT